MNWFVNFVIIDVFVFLSLEIGICGMNNLYNYFKFYFDCFFEIF